MKTELQPYKTGHETLFQDPEKMQIEIWLSCIRDAILPWLSSIL